MSAAPRVVVWVQHLLGTGHTVRAVALARALQARGAAVTVVLGARPPETLDLSGLRVHALPPVRARDARFSAIVGEEDGAPYAALMPARRAAFEAVVARVDPAIIVCESFPLGRSMMADEIAPVLAAARERSSPPLIAVSVRDVLARKTPQKAAAMVARTRALADLVLCHGDPAFVPIEASFPAATALADRLVYTGYVDGGPAPAPSRSAQAAGEIVVSAGGGAGAQSLVRRLAEAVPHLATRAPVRVLVPDVALLGGVALGGRVQVERNRPDFRALLAGAALSVSRAGYNTVVDVLAAGCRALFVPFADGGESEQTDRARALAAKGMAAIVEESAPPERLAAAIDAALAAPVPQRTPVRRDGAERAAQILLCAERAHREGRPLEAQAL